MNEEQVQPKEDKRVQISHRKYFRLCEELRNRQEQVMGMTEYAQVHQFMIETLGFDMSVSTVKGALKDLNIALTKPEKKRRARELNEKTKNNTRTLAAAVLALYKKLGEQPPDTLVALYNKFQYGDKPAGEQVPPPEVPTIPKPPAPIPVLAVPDPRSIRVTPPVQRR